MTKISEWARFDAYLVGLLATMLKTERSAAMAMFVAANNQGAQKDMVIAAARATLEPDDFELLERVFKKVAPLRKQRNKIAHSVWLRHPSLSHELICADPIAIGTYQGHHADAMRGPKTGQPLPISGLEGARIWDEADAILAAEHAMHATIGIQHFWTYLMLGRNDFEEVDAILPRRINFRTEVESWVQFILPTKTQIKERLNSGENL
ncbi:MAG TPA: hypothetical protein VK325_01075 [Pseudoxanthomonas sp.]|nr:hypothetical protein [Pseudoxanthomonas sp.]